jgi:type IV secretory pathway VirB2 component (pilin)
VNPDLQPAGSQVLAAAVQWLQGTLLGALATTISVIAVACVGFLLLSGRIDVRRAAQVIAGCFIIFGASSIASGIVRAATDQSSTPAVALPPAPLPALVAQPSSPPVKTAPYDPYAGAALPTRP